MKACPHCGAHLTFCSLQARRYRLSLRGLHIEADCNQCGTAVTGRSWFPLVVLLAAVLFLMVQLRVFDLTAVFARFSLQESSGEAIILVGLLTMVSLLACRMK
jgi:hypothetical protein